MDRPELTGCTGFEWDDGNAVKNWKKHGVTQSECEQMFLNRPLVVMESDRDAPERRYYALGRTDRGRPLFSVFTVRGDKVRVISARPMSRRERSVYDDARKKENPDV